MSYAYHDVPTATAVVDNEYAYHHKTTPYGSNSTKKEGGPTDSVIRGEMQPPAYRDGFFGLLFWVQLVIVVVLSVMYATGRVKVDFDEFNDHGSFRGRFLASSSGGSGGGGDGSIMPFCVAVVASLVMAPSLTVGLFSYMYHNATQLIQTSIYMAIVMNIVLTVILLISGSILPAILTALGAVFTWCYARYVWHRIPLAAANLKTAIASIRSQLGVAFLGLASIPLYIVWWATWIYFFVCSLNTSFMKDQVEYTRVVEHNRDYDGSTDDYVNIDMKCSSLWYFLLFLMLVSFYWTNQVLANTVQTTVAGSVGTFWFAPDEAVGCCSPAMGASLYRSVTYSFGSICLGSLIVAIIQAIRALLRQAEHQARNNQDNCGAILLCLIECLLSMVESAAEYFNQWAFIYVGLYGYSYMEAGHNVITLFRERGWTSIITDNLTGRVLGMMSFAIGLGTGLLAALVAIVSGMFVSSGSTTVGAVAGGSLVIGLFLGLILASIIFSVVNSAAETIIVLFAEAPAEFQHNHPILSAEMNQAWAGAYDWFNPSANTMVV